MTLHYHESENSLGFVRVGKIGFEEQGALLGSELGCCSIRTPLYDYLPVSVSLASENHNCHIAMDILKVKEDMCIGVHGFPAPHTNA